MRFLTRFALAALVAFLVSSFIATASYFLGFWLGRNSSTLVQIIYNSIPLAFLLGLAPVAEPRRRVEENGPHILALLVGASVGFLYSFVVARRHFATWAVFVLMLSCWVPSGISAIAATVGGKRISSIVGIVMLCLAAIFLPEPIYDLAAHNQRLTVAFITPAEISTEQLEVYPDCSGFENNNDIQTAKNEVLERVRALGYTQTFRVLSVTRRGKGRKSLAILVVRAPVTKEVTLQVPDKSTVVYIQQSDNWDKKPPGVSLLRRGITLEPPGTTGEGRDYKILGDFGIPDAEGVSLIGMLISRTPVESH